MSQYGKHDSSSSSSTSSSPEHSSNKHSSGMYQASSYKSNVFANDGSFLEMFKKYQQKQSEQEEKVTKDVKKVETIVEKSKSPTIEAAPAASSSKPTPAIPMIGKRRGGKILPTGKVKKLKNDEDDDDTADIKPKDAWSVYMSEVKRYRDTVCQSDDKTRPLVK
uniref:Uncharacterized protein C19orf43 n=1 Tax=Cacopsylla melanoneura TaxID=428564 RepID=A0A8D8LHW2_9HEMI